MNKFLNILVAIVCLVSMMATAREGSFSSGGYSSSSSYSPSYSSSDWGSSSSSSSSSSYSSSDWSWGSSSSSWDDDDDDDDWGFSSSSQHRSTHLSNRSYDSYGRSNRQTRQATQCTNPYCPVHGNHKFFLYQLYAIPVDLAAYYVNVSGKATQEEKDLWTKTLYSSDHIYEKGKAPEKSEEIQKFIETIAENKPAYLEYLKQKKAKEEAEARRIMKGILMYGFIPMITLIFCLIIYINSTNKS